MPWKALWPIEVTLAGNLTVSSLAASWKVLWLIVVILVLDRSREVRVEPWKALFPILVSPAGKVNVSSLVTPLKASFPIEVMLSGKVSEVIPEALKASLPIEVKLAGNFTVARLPVFWKTLLPRVVLPLPVILVLLKSMLSSPELEKA